MKDIGSAGGVQSYWGRYTKSVLSGGYGASPGTVIHYMMAVLSGIRCVRVRWVCVAVPCCETAWSDESAVECALMLLLFPGSVAIRRFLFLIMPRRRDCDKSVRESNNDLKRM